MANKIRAVADRVAYLRKRVRALNADMQHAQGRVQHFTRQLAEAVRQWKAADARKDESGRRKAKVKATHFRKKLAFWLEQRALIREGQKGYVSRLRRQRKKLAFLRNKRDEARAPASGVTVPVASWNPYARPIAAWMIPWITKSRQNGWNGVVVSGWRDPAYSESLCFNMCGRATCPGMCAGRGSGHSQSTYPGGCIDVSDYWTFASVQRQIGSPLKNDLPSDRVHFSVTGH